MQNPIVDPVTAPGGGGVLDVTRLPGPDKIDAAAEQVNKATVQLDLPEVPRQKDRLGPALSPDEIKQAGAYGRFLARRPEIAASAKVDLKVHDDAIQRHVVLEQAGAAYGEIGTVARGGIAVVDATLTEKTDGVERYVAGVRADPKISYDVKEALRIAHEPVELIYQRLTANQAARQAEEARREQDFQNAMEQHAAQQRLLAEQQRIKSAPVPAGLPAPVPRGGKRAGTGTKAPGHKTPAGKTGTTTGKKK